MVRGDYILNTIFSENLKFYRLEKNYSQEKLAELSSLHRTYIGGIEAKKRNVSLNNIEKLAQALEIEPYLLLKKRNDCIG